MKSKITINAPVILAFVGLMILGYYGAIRTNGMLIDQFLSIHEKADLNDPYTYVRLLGHLFGYNAASELRYDVLLLLMIGPMVEEKNGSGKVLGVIFAVAVVTGFIHYAVFSEVTLMGARGVVYALIIMGSFTGDRDGSIPLSFIVVALVYLFIQIHDGYYAQNTIYEQMTLAYVAESVVGGIIGGIFAFKK